MPSIPGVVLAPRVVYEDERGDVCEVLSVNLGDTPAPHAYLCSVRPGVIKAFHCHVRAHDGQPGQTDRFVPIRGQLLVGLIDLRGPVYSSGIVDARWTYHGVDGQPRAFTSVWPSDRAWVEAVGESEGFLCSERIVLNSERPALLAIPPGVAHGIRSLSAEPSALANFPTVPYHRPAPDELRLPVSLAEFDWSLRSG